MPREFGFTRRDLKDYPEPTRAQWDAFHERMEKRMTLCPKCSWPLGGDEGEIPKCINPICEYDPMAIHIGTPESEIRTGPGDPVSLEIRNDGNMVAHCDKDDVWWLHVSGEEFKFRQLIEMMILLEESLDNLRKAMKDMVS